VKNSPQCILTRVSFQDGSRIGDHRKVARCGSSDQPFDLLSEVIQRRRGLAGRPRFAGDNEQHLCQVDPPVRRQDLVWVGGVDDLELQSFAG